MAKVLLLLLVCLLGTYPATLLAQQESARATSSSNKAASTSVAFDATFCDGGHLRLYLEAEQLEFETPYGKLQIPTDQIRQVQLALRLTAAEQKRLDDAIFQLGSSDFSQRSEASAALLGLGAKAYPAVVKAAKHADLEVAQRSQDMAAKLREVLTEEELNSRDYDVIETEHSSIAGTLVASRLNVRTTQFGKQPLELSDVRLLVNSTADVVTTEVADAAPDPGNLLSFHGSIGKTLAFKVTGRAEGVVYGTGVYTTDSALATAAVHAGVLKPGETGTVRVTMLSSPPAFASSVQHGVSSYAWGLYPAAYQIVVPKKKPR